MNLGWILDEPFFILLNPFKELTAKSPKMSAEICRRSAQRNFVYIANTWRVLEMASYSSLSLSFSWCARMTRTNREDYLAMLWIVDDIVKFQTVVFSLKFVQGKRNVTRNGAMYFFACGHAKRCKACFRMWALRGDFEWAFSAAERELASLFQKG